MIKHRQYNLHEVGDQDMPESTQKVKFKRGQSGTMPSDLEAGSLLVQVDTGDIFLDNTESDRIQLGDSRKLALSGGTMTGPINMGGQKITNIGNPTDNNDVANKIFVDTAFQELESEMGTTLAGYLQLKGGTMSGVLDMGGHYIQNLETPQADDEAANKGYVDGQVEGLQSTVTSSLNNYLPLSGGTLTGALTLNGNPNQDNHAANKSYVDSQISGLSSIYLPLSGGTLTGPLVLSGNPTQSNQAANKQYVDDTLAGAVGGITGFEVDSNNGSGYANYEALTSAHPTGEVGTFYLVVNPDSSAPNAFDEYFWTGTGYEKAGGFGDVDTSDLATKDEVAKKADKVSAATERNFASLTSDGNLADSGKKAADFASATDVEGLKTSKLDKANAVINFTGAFTAQADMQNGPAEVEVSSIVGSKVSGAVRASTYATKLEADEFQGTKLASQAGVNIDGGVCFKIVSMTSTPIEDLPDFNETEEDGHTPSYAILMSSTVRQGMADSEHIQTLYCDSGSIYSRPVIYYSGNYSNDPWIKVGPNSGGDSSNFVLKSGDTMTGNLNMGSHKVTGLGTPSADSDAATKAYVDDAVADVQVPSSVANQFLTATAATTATKTITGTRPSSGSIFFVLFQNGVTASSGTFTFSFSVGGTCSVSGGSGFPTMPTIAIPAWTMGTFYMNSATTAKFIAYTNYIDDGVVS